MWIDELQASLQSLGGILAIPALYFAIECFFGYRFFRVTCAISGFLTGAAGTAALLAVFGIDTAPWQYLLSVAAGLLIGGMSYKVYRFGVFVSGVRAGFAVVLGLLAPAYAWIAAIVMGIVAAMLAKPAIVVSTAVSGGIGLTGCLFALLGEQSTTVTSIVCVLICALGMVVQLKTTKRL